MADGNPTPEQMSKGKLLGSRAVAPQVTNGADEELARYSRLRSQVYATYYKNIDEDNKYYERKFGADILPKEWRDEGHRTIIPPTARLAVDAAAEHILSTPKIFRPPVPTDASDIDASLAADKVTSALQFFWHNVFVHGSALEGAKKKVVKDGRAILKVELRWDLISPGATVYGRKDWMWRVKLCANETVMLDPDDPYDPSYSYESYLMRREEALKLFPEAKGDWMDEKRNPLDTVNYVEMFTKPSGSSQGKRIVWIENERVIDTVNPYNYVCDVDEDGEDLYDGWVPYACAPSGWGDVDSQNRPEDRYVGILRHMHDVLEAEAQQATAVLAQLRVATFPPIKTWGMPTDKERPFRFGPAAVMRFNGPRDQMDAEVMNIPGLPAGIIDILNRTHAWANEISHFSTLSGGTQRGVDTATEADLNVRNASSRLTPVITGLVAMITRVNMMFLKTIELILEAPMVLYGASEAGVGVVQLFPEEVGGFYMTFVTLQTLDQASLDRANLKTWADAFNAFRLDPEYAMRKAGIENPMERIQKSADYQVFIDPMMHQARVAAALGQGGIAAVAALRAIEGSNMAQDPAAAPNQPDAGNPMGFVPNANPLTGEAAEANAVTEARSDAMTARPDLLMMA